MSTETGPSLVDLFKSFEMVELLGKVAQRGFTLRWRVQKDSKRGGTWVAQVSRDGSYVRAQHTHPVEAVRRLIERMTKERERCWQRWAKRPWRRE